MYQSSNSTVNSVGILPRPGYGLLGSNADGIHFLMTGPNNHIRNCYVTRTMDDALIMDSGYAGILVSQSGTRQVTVNRNGYIRFANGSSMDFVDRTTTLESQGGVIVSQTPADSPGPTYQGQVTLTFDHDLPTLPAGTIMAFGTPASRGQGSTIEDNLVEDTFGGRGVWLPGVQGVTVQRNVLRRTSDSAITVASSTESVVDPGDAGPPAHDITITDNAIEQPLGPQAAGSGLEDALAGIQVVTVSDPYFVFASTPSNTNITIQNNYIADSERSGIWVGELTGGVLQNNLVIRSSQNPTLGGVAGIPTAFQTEVMQDALLPEVVHFSSAVNQTNETITATSKITAPVTMNPPGATAPAGTASGSFALQTAINGFAWNAISDSAWLSVTSQPLGAGNGTVQFSLAANNTGAVRTGKVVMAGESFVVTQTTGATVPCNITGGQTTSVADISAVLREALGSSAAAHDLTGDGQVNVIDIQRVLNALYGFGCQ